MNLGQSSFSANANSTLPGSSQQISFLWSVHFSQWYEQSVSLNQLICNNNDLNENIEPKIESF
jgi:hypothetical protein